MEHGRNILTVSLEDYFQVITFRRLVPQEQWKYFEARLERNTRRALDLLDQHSAKATFFVVGWIADRYPEIVQEVVRRGHEVANKGYYLRSFREVIPEELRDNMERAKDAIERASGQRVLGCRVPQQWFDEDDLWALDLLAEQGYLYDSSMVPMFWSTRRNSWRRFAHKHRSGQRVIWEFPISTQSIGGLNVPIAGGNYLRQFPRWFTDRAIDRWMETPSKPPLVMYFHIWELDPGQNRITAASPLARLRHYRNLDRMPELLDRHLKRYRFGSIRDYLVAAGETVPAAPAAGPKNPQQVERPVARVRTAHQRKPVTLVVPCFNEEVTLPYLAKNLEELKSRMEGEYDLSYLFVDDHSQDGTLQQLRALFGQLDQATVVSHPDNQGVAASIMTGIRLAETEIVCSLDCDCTYDPCGLLEMIPQLRDGVDMVTGSPYHPAGKVENVPAWRLKLSKAATALYSLVLRNKLHTYTSCFRVYRRSSVCDLPLENGGFIGVAELLGRLDLAGGKIEEHPATLRVRLMGRSKMRVFRAVAGHLKLIARLAIERAFRRRGVPTVHGTGRREDRIQHQIQETEEQFVE